MFDIDRPTDSQIRHLAPMILARIALAAAPLLLSSCATAWHTTEEIPDRAELVGSYTITGDGLGVCMSIDLSDGGTFSAVNCGGVHRGDGTSEKIGRWQLEQNHIFFYDAKGKYDPAAYFNYAEIFYYKDRPAFVLARHLHQGKAHEWFVFTKDSGRDGVGAGQGTE